MVHLNNDAFIDAVVNDFVNGWIGSYINFGSDSAATVWFGFDEVAEFQVGSEFGIGGNSLHPNIRSGDIDGDGDNDILLGEWSSGVDSLYFLPNPDSGYLADVERLFLDDFRLTKSFNVFDYEQDGDADIVAATDQNDLMLFRNNGSGSFERFNACDPSQFSNTVMTMTTAKLNSDALDDVAVLTLQSDFAVMLNAEYLLGIPDAKNPPTPVPQSFQLEQNYPNPFNPTTTINYQLSTAGTVSLRIYDINGRLVRQLAVNSLQSAGQHRVRWDGRNDSGHLVASGVYFYRLRAHGEPGLYSRSSNKHHIATKKMILLR